MSDVVERDGADNGEPLEPPIDVICAHIACITEELGNLNAEITRLRAREATLSTECNHWMSEANRLRLAVAAETERCARVAEGWLASDYDEACNTMAQAIIDDIMDGDNAA